MSTATMTAPIASAHPVPVPFGGPQMLVLDTGVIYNDIIYRLRNPNGRGALIGSAKAGSTVLLAGEHVYDEVYDSLTGHERRGFSRAAVVSCFERIYLPHLRFVSMPAWPVPRRVVPVGVVDPDDAPTAALALLVAPSLVFAIDPHLVDAGFGRAEDWLSLTFQADELLGCDGTLLMAGLGVRGLGRGVASAARWFVNDLRPIDVAAGAAAALGLILMAPRAADTVLGGAQRAGRGLGHVAGEVAMVMAQIAAQRGKNTAALHAASVTADLPAGLQARLARHLAPQTAPMSAEHLALALGLDFESVIEALAEHPAFIHNGHGWQLGRHRLPRGRELPVTSAGRPPR
jgi:hypothetical protein